MRVVIVVVGGVVQEVYADHEGLTVTLVDYAEGCAGEQPYVADWLPLDDLAYLPDDVKRALKEKREAEEVQG